MTTFHIQTVGATAAGQIVRLSQLLTARGAVASAEGSCDLYLVGADTVADAAAALENMDEQARSRTLLVGVPGDLDIRRPAAEGTLAGLLERYHPLGVMTVRESWRPELAGFIGPKELAERIDAGFAKQFASKHYATWFRCEGEDAGDFLVRLVARMA